MSPANPVIGSKLQRWLPGTYCRTAVVFSGVVQADPASEVGHWPGPCPIRIILMPRHDAAVFGRLAEELIVPEADGSAEELAGRNQKRWIQRRSWKPGVMRQAPSVEQHAAGSADSLEWYSWKRLLAGWCGSSNPCNSCAQRLNLLVREDANAL